MTAGREAATAVDEFLATGNPKALAGARKRFMKAHGRVFWILGMMQYFWYSSDKRRERFVKICDDPDVQRLTWQAYMNKELVRADPMAHLSHLPEGPRPPVRDRLDRGMMPADGDARVRRTLTPVVGRHRRGAARRRGRLDDDRPRPVVPRAAPAVVGAARLGVPRRLDDGLRLHRRRRGDGVARAARPASGRRLIALFAFNAFLNMLWSLIFFRLHRPDWALVEVAVFWLSIVALIVVAARRRGARLLLPALSRVGQLRERAQRRRRQRSTAVRVTCAVRQRPRRRHRAGGDAGRGMVV